MEISKFEQQLGVNGEEGLNLLVSSDRLHPDDAKLFMELSKEAYTEWEEKFESWFMRSDGLPSEALQRYKRQGTWCKMCERVYTNLCAKEFDKVIELENIKMEREKHAISLYGKITHRELVATMKSHLTFMRLSVPKYMALRSELKMKAVKIMLDQFTDELIEQIADEASAILMHG